MGKGGEAAEVGAAPPLRPLLASRPRQRQIFRFVKSPKIGTYCVGILGVKCADGSSGGIKSFFAFFRQGLHPHPQLGEQGLLSDPRQVADHSGGQDD